MAGNASNIPYGARDVTQPIVSHKGQQPLVGHNGGQSKMMRGRGQALVSHIVRVSFILVRAKCAAKGCPWEILAPKHGEDNTFRVKTLIEKHSCLPTSSNKRFHARRIAEKFHDEISKMLPIIKGKHIMILVKKKMGLTIHISKARRVRINVMKKIQERYVDEYTRLREYGNEILESNPGSIVCIEVDRTVPDSAPTFQRIYICFKAVKDNFRGGCR